MVRSTTRTAIIFVFLLAALWGAASPLFPARAAGTQTVATCDEVSLRQAISSATSGDTVNFACSGTIALNDLSGYAFMIDKDLTIDGTGQDVTIDGSEKTSTFYIQSSVTLTLNDLTFSGGVGGSYSACDTCGTLNIAGVITNYTGTVNISNSTFSNNISTGIIGGGVILNSPGTVNVTNSTFSSNTAYGSGGAILNISGTLNVSNSTFSGNLVRGNGGAIDNAAGTTTISGSTFDGNTANAYNAEGSGGGISNEGTMTITNSTLSGNVGQVGGAIATSYALNVINSTLSGNSAAIWGNGIATGIHTDFTLAAGGTTTLLNTILANGPVRGNDGIFDYGGNCVTNGTLTDKGGNFDDDGTCGVSQVSTADLKLRSLADNGGPTKTIALGTGSAAIDAVYCLIATPTDQRGYARPHYGLKICDSGAYEAGAVAPIHTTTLSAISGSGTYAGTATVTATLTDSGTGVAGKSIAFTLNGTSIGSATTNGSGVATLSGVSLAGIDAGSYPGAVGASFAGDAGDTSSSGSGTLTVASANQSLTFNLATLPAKSVGDAPFNVNSYANASSGLTIAFSSATPTVCTVSGSTVTIVNSGLCTINANQAGNGNYNAAAQVQQSFSVTNPSPPVTTSSAVTADHATYTFGSWTKQAVTVSLAAADSGGPGIANTYYTLDGGSQTTYTASISINTEDSHTLTFWSVDNNSTEETPHQSVSIKIDLTAPTISGTATTSPNANGWYNGSVTIHWTCSDALSGIATCPSDQTISSEGADQTLSGTATDLAGNSTTVNSSPVSIDLTAPTISGAATTSPNSNGWYNASVTIHWTCSDALSGIATCPSDQTISGEGANQTVSGTATDLAGNSTTVNSSPVSIDLTAPTISGAATTSPNGNGWYNASVTIHWTCSDALSGIATCPSDQTISGEGANQTLSGTATDWLATAPPSTVVRSVST